MVVVSPTDSQFILRVFLVEADTRVDQEETTPRDIITTTIMAIAIIKVAASSPQSSTLPSTRLKCAVTGRVKAPASKQTLASSHMATMKLESPMMYALT